MKCIRHFAPPKFQCFSSQFALHGLRALDVIILTQRVQHSLDSPSCKSRFSKISWGVEDLRGTFRQFAWALFRQFQAILGNLRVILGNFGGPKHKKKVSFNWRGLHTPKIRVVKTVLFTNGHFAGVTPAIFVIFVDFQGLRGKIPCFRGYNATSELSPIFVKTTCFRQGTKRPFLKRPFRQPWKDGLFWLMWTDLYHWRQHYYMLHFPQQQNPVGNGIAVIRYSN